jgi:SAM-dependent methyltransferase
MAQTNWYEAWFSSGYYETLYEHRNSDEANLFLDNLFEAGWIPRTGKVLDAPCGTGRHAHWFSSRDYRVTGLDLSEPFIKKAKDLEQSGKAEFFRHDLRYPFRTNYYDLALNLFTSLGYFATRREDEKILINFYHALKPGGTFVLDFLNADFVVAALKREEEVVKKGQTEFAIRRTFENKHLIKKIHIKDGKTEMEFHERVRAYHFSELERLLTGSGFKIFKTFGDYRLGTFEVEDSPRAIFICHKP